MRPGAASNQVPAAQKNAFRTRAVCVRPGATTSQHKRNQLRKKLIVDLGPLATGAALAQRDCGAPSSCDQGPPNVKILFDRLRLGLGRLARRGAATDQGPADAKKLQNLDHYPSSQSSAFPIGIDERRAVVGVEPT